MGSPINGNGDVEMFHGRASPFLRGSSRSSSDMTDYRHLVPKDPGEIRGSHLALDFFFRGWVDMGRYVCVC